MGLIELTLRGTLFTRIKNYFSFSQLEVKDFHKSNILISLIFFFFIWSYTDMTLVKGIITFLFIYLISAMTLFLFIALPKIIGITRGTTVEYKSPILTLLFLFVINFLSYGFIPIFVPGNLYLKSILRLKHGEVFHYETKNDIFVVLASAPLTHIFISSILLSIYLLIPNTYLFYIIMLNVFFAMFSILPIPGALGIELFYVKKKTYFPLFVGTILFGITTLFKFKYSPLIGILGLFLGWLLTQKNNSLRLVLGEKLIEPKQKK
jgi:hypothetical protein